MKQIIQRPYDSHIHFLLTGEYELSFKFADQTEYFFLREVDFEQYFMRGDFFLARNLDKDLFEKFLEQIKKTPIQFLNELKLKKPIYLVCKDGHTAYLNTLALEYFKKFNIFTEFNGTEKNNTHLIYESDFLEQGIAKEQLHFHLYKNLPSLTDSQLLMLIEKSVHVFHQSGFTHLRDMTMDLNSWKLINQKKPKVYIEAYNYLENLNEFEQKITEVREMSLFDSKFQKTRGIKIFVDGSLHSGTAAFSHSNLCCLQKKTKNWNKKEYSELLKKTWIAGYELAIHAIGDQAVSDIVEWSREVSAQGFLGRLCIEHAEFIDPEIIQKMKALHIEVHMQPSHVLTDALWIENHSESKKLCFNWKKLLASNISVYFGSDSPFYKPSWNSSFKGIQMAAKIKNQISKAQIENSVIDMWKCHSHPDQKTPSSYVVLDENQNIEELYFDDIKIL